MRHCFVTLKQFATFFSLLLLFKSHFLIDFYVSSFIYFLHFLSEPYLLQVVHVAFFRVRFSAWKHYIFSQFRRGRAIFKTLSTWTREPVYKNICRHSLILQKSSIVNGRLVLNDTHTEELVLYCKSSLKYQVGCF